MRKILTLLILLIFILIIPRFADAIEMPEININAQVLYSLETSKISIAEGIGVTLITAFDRILKGNFELAFPDGNQINSDVVGGPVLKADLVKLISKSGKVEIVKDFKLEAGIGVLFDIFHVDGMDIKDWKNITYPTFSLGFSF